MRSLRIASLVLAIPVAAVWLAAALTAQTGGTLIRGTVKSANGAAMEGVTVSARAAGQTFTTTVFTDARGTFAFPELEAGTYTLRAQAAGFVADRAEFAAARGSRPDRTMTLHATKDFALQLDGIDWMAALPEKTPQDLRMKKVVQSNCTGCHQPNFTLLSRFDADGWRKVIDLMGRGVPPNPREVEGPAKTMLEYRDEMAEYLGRVRGVTDQMEFKLSPRPTGAATQVVMTEYDLAYPQRPGYVMKFNGSDWSQGPPPRFEGRTAHDIVIDSQSNVWFSDDRTPGRTIGQLDPKTGKVTDYASNDDNGVATSTFIAVGDHQDNIWSTGRGDFMKFDTRTKKFQFFPREPGIPRIALHMTVDSRGNPAAQAANGSIVKLDVATGKHIEYKPATPDLGLYGLGVSADDSIWMAQPGGDRMMYVDGKTGKVGEVLFEHMNAPWATEKDLRLALTMPGNSNFGWPQQKGGRRLGGDPRGNWLWVANFKSDSIVKINIDTKQVEKEYPVPSKYSGPYGAVVDKNRMVWVQMLNGDRIARFDPKTETWIEYHLPTRNSQMRHLTVDNRTEPPTVWAPYGGTNKIMRMQFRTAR